MCFGNILNVPQEYHSIQSAINMASEGDTVLVSKGKYKENLIIKDKFIVLVSEFYQKKDSFLIEECILEGSKSTILTIWNSNGTIISGFTFLNGDDGISTNSQIEISNNRFINNVDGLDYESGGGICKNNYFSNNKDDAIDLDGKCEVLIEKNLIANNEDDGIEIRYHPFEGNSIQIIITNNQIIGNMEDGIQLIFYPEKMKRHVIIKNNVFEENQMVAIGCMSDGETKEDYRSASSFNSITIEENKFIENNYCITCSENPDITKNEFIKSKVVAFKGKMNYSAFMKNNIFIDNNQDYIEL